MSIILEGRHVPQGGLHGFRHELLHGLLVEGGGGLPEEGQGLGHFLQALALLGGGDGDALEVVVPGDPGFGQEGAQVGLQLLPGGPLHELLVHPGELVHVEAGGALLDVLEVEELDHLLVGEQFFLRSLRGLAIDLGGPGEARQGQAHRGGQEAHGLVFGDAGGAVALAELGAVLAQDHGHVGELRLCVAHGVVEGDLLGGVGDMVVAPDDMAHLHARVVHHHAEVVGGHAQLGAFAGAGDDPVVQRVRRKGQVALDEVGPGDGAVLQPVLVAFGHLQPHGVGLARVVVLVAAAVPGIVAPAVLEGHALGLHRGAAGLQLLLGAAATVGLPFEQQLLHGGLVVALHALHLAVGAMGAHPVGGIAHHRALVPVQAAPGHAFLDDSDVVVGAAAEVRVLHAQDEPAPVLAGEEPAEEGRTHAADVQHAGGGGGETGDDRTGHNTSTDLTFQSD